MQASLQNILDFSVSVNTKSPRQRIYLCQGRIRFNLSAVPPCFTASAVPLSRIQTYPRELTHPYALQNTPEVPFPCTLSGPFDNLFLTRFSASRALCKGIIAVISTSTVFDIQLCRKFTWKRTICQVGYYYKIFTNFLYIL